MQEDDATSPGTRAYWDHFYDEDDGPLRTKQKQLGRNDDATATSIFDHYEWFTTFDNYGDALKAALATTFVPRPDRDRVRVLHVGCGNSAFADHFTVLENTQEAPAASGKKRRGHQAVSGLPSLPTEVLNVDICAHLIQRLKLSFPQRWYEVSDCCDMCTPGDADSNKWWLEGHVVEASVDVIFDKGTMDALLSAFPGDINPNAERYCCEALRALRDGGVIVLLSINSVDVLLPYFVSADAPPHRNVSFRLATHTVLDVADQFDAVENPVAAALRVETLGTRYSLYAFQVVYGGM